MIRGAVLGGDVSKSRSPAIHAAAFKVLGVTGNYLAFSVDAAGFVPLVRTLAGDGYRYLNVTIPHKRAAADLANSRSTLVRATGAANTLIVSRTAGKVSIRAENTDGAGLLAALGDLGVTRLRGQIVVMVGAGGAAAGALTALIGAGARVRLIARRPMAARTLRLRLSTRARGRVSVAAWTPRSLAKALDGADVLVSAVPAAAWDSDDARAGLNGIARGAAVLEMAYGATTPLAKAVRSRIARYQDGLPMLVHQAAAGIALALGRKPPAEPLLRAARRSGSRRSIARP